LFWPQTAASALLSGYRKIASGALVGTGWVTNLVSTRNSGFGAMNRRMVMVLSLGVLSLSLVAIVLARRVNTLGEAYTALQRRASQPYRGYVVPTVTAPTLAGDSMIVGETRDSNSVQVVYVFTTTCPYCRATLPIWDAVTDSARRLYGSSVQVVAMSLDSTHVTARYAESNQLAYPVAFFPDWKAARHYRARVVPQTLVLNRIGEVLYAHIGQLSAGPGLDSLYAAVAAGLAPRSSVAAMDLPQSPP
jgi:peroxiredoxin